MNCSEEDVLVPKTCVKEGLALDVHCELEKLDRGEKFEIVYFPLGDVRKLKAYFFENKEAIFVHLDL